MVKKSASGIYLGLIFLFLYLPIAVLIVLSFNDSRSHVAWGGFTLDWYVSCFRNKSIMAAFATTLQVTLLAAVISTVIGALAAIGISTMKRRNQAVFLGATNIPLLNADIVTGISMMLLFVKFMDLGFITVLIAHITFNIPYVILNVLPKLKQANRATYEAALDLGAKPLYAFYKVTWPEIRPGVFSGFLMAVTMSLDDFSITYFTKGVGVNTLSTMLYTELRKGIRPELYALSTILFLIVLLLLIVANMHPQPLITAAGKSSRRKVYLQRAVSGAIIAAFACGCLAVITSSSASGKAEETLTVLNYGKYFDEDALRQFEEETGITLKYEEYENPEEMYTKYKAGAIDYDLICTSDYMIEKLALEKELLPADYSALPNYGNIDPEIIEMSASFDPDHCYTVPYFYGTLGILYNTKYVEKSEVESWDALWNSSFAGDMIMINSVRDAFAPALITRGYSINETDPERLEEALGLLTAQAPDVSAYYVDETCDEMIAENARIAVCYSGEAAEAVSMNGALDYCVPKEGSNLWIDAWFLPKTCQNKENALLFLDYLCREDVAEANFEYVLYSSPVSPVTEKQDEETRKKEVFHPSRETLQRCEVYRALDDASAARYNTLWQSLKSKSISTP